MNKIDKYYTILPFLSLNEPVKIMMKSTKTPIPPNPKVRSQSIPVPIFPVTKRWTPKAPKKKQITATVPLDILFTHFLIHFVSTILYK